MEIMRLIGLLLYYAIQIYIFILVLRVVLDWVSILARDWRPKGILLVIANFIYGITDPPVRFFGRFIPPLRLGGISLDMGFLVFFISLFVLQRLVILVFLQLPYV